VVMEERSEGILLRHPGPSPAKLTWAETGREMGAARENWSEWDATLADGLEEIPWDRGRSRRVAEPVRGYEPRRRKTR
jgi:hypothetical protein